MKNIMEKMIDHPFSTILVVGAVVNGTSVLVHNIVTAFRK